MIEEGDIVTDNAGEFIHPARRVHLGLGNIGARVDMEGREQQFIRLQLSLQ